MNNGVRKDENDNEPRIDKTKPDKKKKEKEIGGDKEGKAATFRAQSGVRKLGTRGQDSRREVGGHRSNGPETGAEADVVGRNFGENDEKGRGRGEESRTQLMWDGLDVTR